MIHTETKKIVEYYDYNNVANAIKNLDDKSARYFKRYYRYTLAESYIRKNMARGSKILDAGCSVGVLCSKIDADYNVTGADFSRAALEQARTVAPRMTADVVDLQKPLAYRDGGFDCVVCMEVLEHLPDDVLPVKEFSRVLVSGGSLLVMVPYRDEVRLLPCPHCGEKFYQSGHMRSYDKNSLVSVLLLAGFEIKDIFVFNNTLSYKLWLFGVPMFIITGLDRILDRGTHMMIIAEKAI